ncbi:hypothetical protein ACIBG8_44075 [Nonomuraea sp. NPDC050556]|uniref:hypothetical protein n=1 Tax=Nonomuraea sp. NPDC050556 TaxID=3364369 RepID=UPI0037B45DEC
MMIRAFVATAAAMVVFSGTAAAEPVKGAPELTSNALYKAAKLPRVKCALKGVSSERYAKNLVSCLNKAWKKAITDFKPVAAKITKDRTYCYTGMEIAGSYAVACDIAVNVRLADDWTKAKSDLPMFVGIAAAYSGVVLGQSGIGEAYWALDAGGNEKQSSEQDRRLGMQGDCLLGVSMKSLGRPVSDWPKVFTLTRPKEFNRYKTHAGRTTNRVYWAKRGYASGKPGSCNTWTAPSSKVS